MADIIPFPIIRLPESPAPALDPKALLFDLRAQLAEIDRWLIDNGDIRPASLHRAVVDYVNSSTRMLREQLEEIEGMMR